ncbi:hypothetical protein ABN034_02690 [Actinopolymorpha sp. B11F2]
MRKIIPTAPRREQRGPEYGNRDALMRRHGLYAELDDLQACAYR